MMKGSRSAAADGVQDNHDAALPVRRRRRCPAAHCLHERLRLRDGAAPACVQKRMLQSAKY